MGLRSQMAEPLLGNSRDRALSLREGAAGSERLGEDLHSLQGLSGNADEISPAVATCDHPCGPDSDLFSMSRSLLGRKRWLSEKPVLHLLLPNVGRYTFCFMKGQLLRAIPVLVEVSSCCEQATWNTPKKCIWDGIFYSSTRSGFIGSLAIIVFITGPGLLGIRLMD